MCEYEFTLLFLYLITGCSLDYCAASALSEHKDLCVLCVPYNLWFCPWLFPSPLYRAGKQMVE